MAVQRRRLSAIAVITIFCYASAIGSRVAVGLAVKEVEETKQRQLLNHHQWPEDKVWKRSVSLSAMRNPGSSPPTCRCRCGVCFPCRPVHVPIQPGVLVTPLDYYPQAWRCTCGNNYFMP